MSSGRACIGSFMLRVKKLLPSAVKSRGAVSPIARESASRMPVKIPDSAVGMNTERKERQRVKPKRPSSLGDRPRRQPQDLHRRDDDQRQHDDGQGDRAREAREMALRDHDQRVDEDADHDRGEGRQHVDEEPRADAARPPTSTRTPRRATPTGTAMSVARPVISSVPTIAFRMPPPVALRSPGGS